MKSILVIDDEKSVREVLKAALRESGYEVHDAENGNRGIELFRELKPDIVLTDVNMPDISGLAVTAKIKDRDAETEVVIMTGYGSEDIVVEALRAGASNYIKKPIIFKELNAILDRIYQKKNAKKRYEVLKDIIVEEKKSLLIGNDITKAWGAVNQVLFNVPPKLPDRLLEGMKLGLYEIIVNAIEHGNLGISFSDKEKALNNGTYHLMFQERLQRANEEGKKVAIHTTLNGSGISIEVGDDGRGFDFTKLAPALDSDRIMSAHGRGILLASLYFERVEYQKPGNRVILTRSFSS